MALFIKTFTLLATVVVFLTSNLGASSGHNSKDINIQIAHAIKNANKISGIPENVYFTIMSIESNFEPLAISVVTSEKRAKLIKKLHSPNIKVLVGGKAFHQNRRVVSIYPKTVEYAKLIAKTLKENKYSFAVGLTQIDTSNFSLSEVEQMFDPKKNLEKSAKVLKGCYKRFGNLTHRIECYNRGGGNLNRMLKTKKRYYPYYARYKKHHKKYFSK